MSLNSLAKIGKNLMIIMDKIVLSTFHCDTKCPKHTSLKCIPKVIIAIQQHVKYGIYYYSE